ncbi:MAG: mercury methylation corrinoid protein HgcA [Methanomassiliicoccales archaeon]
MEDGYGKETMATVAELGAKERNDHIKARIGIDRMGHWVRPGLYALGTPDRTSSVLVTANYSLSFDALRSSLPGRSVWILVLDTKGINVWCAAGKRTFGTEELIKAVQATDLAAKVEGRKLILPQLAAPGVSAHEVKKGCGFRVEYGPVRADDLAAFLDTGECTEEMRTVRFNLRDRLVLAPVEIRNYRWWMILLLLAAVFVPFYGPLVLALTLGGIFLFPAFLPYLPSKDLSLKGIILGLVLVTPFALYQLFFWNGTFVIAAVVAEYLLMAAWLGYLGLNFTGSTTFTSRTGVRREIFTYIPPMAGMAVLGGALAVCALVLYAGWL